MKILGQSFNLMTLGGLAAAVGLVIDDKIVVVENIVLHRDGGEGPLQATASALKELTVPLIGSTLTPIVVFLPLITITGVTGTFFSALAIAMSVSLLSSLVLALVWTSNLSTKLVRRGQTAIRRLRRRSSRPGAPVPSRVRRRPQRRAIETDDGGGGSIAERRVLRTRPACLRTDAAASVEASRLARRVLRRAHGGVLRVLPGARQRSAAGVRRGRICPRLRDAAGQFASGNESRALARRGDSCVRHPKSKAHRGAPGWSSAWRP